MATAIYFLTSFLLDQASWLNRVILVLSTAHHILNVSEVILCCCPWLTYLMDANPPPTKEKGMKRKEEGAGS